MSKLNKKADKTNSENPMSAPKKAASKKSSKKVVAELPGEPEPESKLASLPALAQVRNEAPTLPPVAEPAGNNQKQTSLVTNEQPTFRKPNTGNYKQKKALGTINGDVNKPSGGIYTRIGNFQMLRMDFTNYSTRLLVFDPKQLTDFSHLALVKRCTTDELIRQLVRAEIDAYNNGSSLISLPSEKQIKEHNEAVKAELKAFNNQG